jgi:hypothetical protein
MTSHPVHIEPPVLTRWASSPTGVAYVHERAASAAGPEVLVTALVHGNEYSGALALDALLRSGLQPHRGRITAAFCNIDAFGRFDAAGPDASRFIDEDFNRVWSADALDGAGQTAERLRARALRPFVDRATHLLDLHSMHEPCVPLLVTGQLPRNIAFAQGLQVAGEIIVDAGHADGQRMRDYGPFGGGGAQHADAIPGASRRDRQRRRAPGLADGGCCGLCAGDSDTPRRRAVHGLCVHGHLSRRRAHTQRGHNHCPRRG